jgi:hypothetical protein
MLHGGRKSPSLEAQAQCGLVLCTPAPCYLYPCVGNHLISEVVISIRSVVLCVGYNVSLAENLINFNLHIFDHCIAECRT